MHDGAHAADVARTAVPGVTVTLWPAATHSLPLEQAAALDRAMVTFMAAQPRRMRRRRRRRAPPSPVADQRCRYERDRRNPECPPEAVREGGASAAPVVDTDPAWRMSLSAHDGEDRGAQRGTDANHDGGRDGGPGDRDFR
jgi:hypothetical protein